MDKITALIAEDEPALRQRLKEMLKKLWPELTIEAEAGDGESALERFKRQPVDIAFLDIRMPGLDGLSVAASLAGRCHIIFVTAYDQYAVEAFEHEAVDYLLKPLNEERLQQSIERIQQRMQQHPPDEDSLTRVLQLLDRQSTTRRPEYLKWIRALKGEEIHLIATADVLYFQAGDKYTTVVTAAVEYLIRKPVKELESELNPELFWRIHRSTIVNLEAVEHSQRDLSGGYTLSLKGSRQRLKVSRGYAHLFKQM